MNNTILCSICKNCEGKYKFRCCQLKFCGIDCFKNHGSCNVIGKENNSPSSNSVECESSLLKTSDCLSNASNRENYPSVLQNISEINVLESLDEKIFDYPFDIENNELSNEYKEKLKTCEALKKFYKSLNLRHSAQSIFLPRFDKHRFGQLLHDDEFCTFVHKILDSLEEVDNANTS